MNETRFTPGPWEIKPCSNGGAFVKRGEAQQTQIVPEADAHLIAAAPDMYAEACIALDFYDKRLKNSERNFPYSLSEFDATMNPSPIEAQNRERLRSLLAAARGER